MENLKIFIVTHKNVTNKITKKVYYYLGVGNNDIDVDYKDKTNDNIANKNSTYCELTAQYWIYKNIDSKYVGLVHYRRFFYKNTFNYLRNNVLDSKYILNKLKKYDAILPYRPRHWKNVYDSFASAHFIRDLDNCGTVIKKRYPEYYLSFLNLKKMHKSYVCNMIITSKKIFDDYSKWLFEILEDVEKMTNMTDYDDYQKRLYGFLSERLINVYFDYHKELRILEKPIFMVNDKNNSFKSRLTYFIETKTKKINHGLRHILRK